MNPKIINSRYATMNFPQGRAHVEVEESVTNYYVSVRPIEWQGFVIEYYKVPKKSVYNMMHAVEVAYKDYMDAGNKWNWE